MIGGWIDNSIACLEFGVGKCMKETCIWMDSLLDKREIILLNHLYIIALNEEDISIKLIHTSSSCINYAYWAVAPC